MLQTEVINNEQDIEELEYIDPTLDLEFEILELKKKLNAVILAHYYQENEIQDIADYVGDSLQLAQQAEGTDAGVIVFAGVHFMAETAKILNPNKLVVLPDLEAGCSLAEGCPPHLLKKFKGRYPDHVLISYINCSAGVKALSDIICTSSNAEKVVNSVPENKGIIFAPDKNLGKYLIKKTGRDMILWQGSCIVHETFSEKKIAKLALEHPNAKIIAHPECEEAVLNKADFIGSTSQLIKFVQEDNSNEFIVATEPGVIKKMSENTSGKLFIPAPPESNCSCNECPYMRLNTMEKLYLCMKNKRPEIILDKGLTEKALVPIKRMLEISK
ncbi:MAG: quinolinate synthase NadA [Ignavibacteria bacterium]|nr:quinolinate synthase NadA [Ignavibacteria bacterium]